MKPHTLLAVVLAAMTLPAAWAQPARAQRANEPVFRSGPWFVVRSVRDGGKVVACTGFYKANRNVQLSKDMLAIRAPVEIRSVALGFDGRTMGAPRPLSKAEQELGAFAVTGEDFAQLARSSKLRLEVATVNGTASHTLELRGLQGALESINAGCPPRK
jgi:hypothetical protein